MNLAIDVHPARRTATSRCTFTVLQSPEPGRVVIALVGDYHDQYERVSGRWRFTDRTVDPALIGDLSGHMQGRST